MEDAEDHPDDAGEEYEENYEEEYEQLVRLALESCNVSPGLKDCLQRRTMRIDIS
jgi:hypothetical protein